MLLWPFIHPGNDRKLESGVGYEGAGRLLHCTPGVFLTGAAASIARARQEG